MSCIGIGRESLVKCVWFLANPKIGSEFGTRFAHILFIRLLKFKHLACLTHSIIHKDHIIVYIFPIGLRGAWQAVHISGTSRAYKQIKPAIAGEQDDTYMHPSKVACLTLAF